MSLFSKRHYVYLESVCRDIMHNAKQSESAWGPNEDCVENAKIIIEELADGLKSDNINFCKQRFLKEIYNPEEIYTTTKV